MYEYIKWIQGRKSALDHSTFDMDMGMEDKMKTTD